VATTLSAPDISEAGIPVYTDPARAVRAIGAVAAFSESMRRRAPVERLIPDAGRVDRVRSARTRGGPAVRAGVRGQAGAGRVRHPVSREAIADSAEAAVAAARELAGRSR